MDYPCTCTASQSPAVAVEHAAGCAAAPLSELGIVQPHPPDGFRIHELFADRATLLARLAVAERRCAEAEAREAKSRGALEAAQRGADLARDYYAEHGDGRVGPALPERIDELHLASAKADANTERLRRAALADAPPSAALDAALAKARREIADALVRRADAIAQGGDHTSRPLAQHVADAVRREARRLTGDTPTGGCEATRARIVDAETP